MDDMSKGYFLLTGIKSLSQATSEERGYDPIIKASHNSHVREGILPHWITLMAWNWAVRLDLMTLMNSVDLERGTGNFRLFSGTYLWRLGLTFRGTALVLHRGKSLGGYAASALTYCMFHYKNVFRDLHVFEQTCTHTHTYSNIYSQIDTAILFK